MTAAEEVADDYRRELEELSGINRAEISTLTMIARESTEHAMAISEVLVQHILKVCRRAISRVVFSTSPMWWIR